MKTLGSVMFGFAILLGGSAFAADVPDAPPLAPASNNGYKTIQRAVPIKPQQSSFQPIAQPTQTGLLTDDQRMQIARRLNDIDTRADELSHAEADSKALKLKVLQNRRTLQKISLTERERRYYQDIANRAEVSATLADSQVREYDQTRSLQASLRGQLQRDKALQTQAAKLRANTAPIASPRTFWKTQRYGAKQNFPTMPMKAADRAKYEQRFAEWKQRVKELEALDPDGKIKAYEARMFDMGNKLKSPVIPSEDRVGINEQIRQNHIYADQLQQNSDLLREARRIVFDMNNEIRRDDERKIRLQAGGVFSDPRYQ